MSDRTKYVIAMMLIMPIDAVFAVTYWLGTGQQGTLIPGMMLGVIMLIGVNGVFAYRRFKPLHDFLEGAGSFEAARARAETLTQRSVVWIIGLGVVYLLLRFGAVPYAFDNDVMLRMQWRELISLCLIYVAYFSLVYFFLVSDFVAGLENEALKRYSVRLSDTKGRLAMKLILAVLVMAALIMVAVVSNAYFMDITVARGELIQAGINSIFAVLVAIILVARNFNRPLVNLVQAIEGVQAGRLDVRVPVLHTDEIGGLTSAFNDMVDGLRERAFVRESTGRFVSSGLVGSVVGESRGHAAQSRFGSAVFVDLDGVHAALDRLTPQQVVELSNAFLDVVGKCAAENRGVLTNAMGTTAMVVFNLPQELPDHTERAVKCAIAIRDTLATQPLPGDGVYRPRIGVNSGELVSGPIEAVEGIGYTVIGEALGQAVHLSRLAREYGTGLMVSQIAVERIEGHLPLVKRGEAHLQPDVSGSGRNQYIFGLVG